MLMSNTKAFSSEVGTGSREENASNKESRVPFRSCRNGKGSPNRFILTGALLVILSAAGGCSAIDRITQIGEQPKLAAIENPTSQPGYKPVQMPMPKPEVASYNANSLWRNGSRAFFKDQRAARIGDILTVTVNFTDNANINNETKRDRTSKEDSGISDFIGAQTITQAHKILPGKLLTTDSTSKYDGSGSVDRKENLKTNVAAVVTQVRGYPERQHHRLKQDRAGPHRLWRPRPDHRLPAAALRPAVHRHPAAVLKIDSPPLAKGRVREGSSHKR